MQTWNEIEKFYDRLEAESRIHVLPIQTIIFWLRDHGLYDRLHAYTSMHDLVISDQPKTTWDQHTLRISVVSDEGRVAFRYSRHDGAMDTTTKEVELAEANETLRQFLIYKFGIYEKKEPNNKGYVVAERSGADKHAHG